jgi:uncharacterized damage-inducible protein DinB
MTSVPVFQELFDYNYWARDRQLEVCAVLRSEEFIRPLGNSFPSVRDTLAHLLGAEWVWLERWNGRFPRAMLHSSEFPNVVSIQQCWRVVERNMREYLAGLSDDSLSRPLTYTNMKGENWTYPLWRMLFQLINHQTYHRGQVTTMLRQIGAEPKSIDFLIAHDVGFQALSAISKR